MKIGGGTLYSNYDYDYYFGECVFFLLCIVVLIAFLGFISPHIFTYSYIQDEDNFICSPASKDTDTDCATKNTEVPWVVNWHVIEHAEGSFFTMKLKRVLSTKASILHGPNVCMILLKISF